jgi:hypothetical protein
VLELEELVVELSIETVISWPAVKALGRAAGDVSWLTRVVGVKVRAGKAVRPRSTGQLAM